MILVIKFPRMKSSYAWVEAVFRNKYKTRQIKYHRFLTGEESAQIVGISSRAIFRKISVHKKAHGFIWNGDFFVHPDSVALLIKSKFKSLITRTLKELPTENSR